MSSALVVPNCAGPETSGGKQKRRGLALILSLTRPYQPAFATVSCAGATCRTRAVVTIQYCGKQMTNLVKQAGEVEKKAPVL
eukprot:1152251-Pelagomonas_calceolata.AAC.1